MRAISWNGVILGGITDIVATNIVETPLAIIAVRGSNFSSLPASERGQALVALMQGSPGIQMSGWVLGAMCSVLGGYVAARLAKRDELMNGALSASFCVGLGVYSLVGGHSPFPLWQHLIAVLGTPFLGAYGGYLCARRANRMPVEVKTSEQPT